MSNGAGEPLDALVTAQPDLRGPAQRLREEHTDLETEQQHAEHVAADSGRDAEDVRDAARPLMLAVMAHVQHTDHLLDDASLNA